MSDGSKWAQGLEALEGKIDLESAFPETSGFGIKGVQKARHKLLCGVADDLAGLLNEGETVRAAVRVVQHFPAEAVFGGAAVSQMVNQNAFVITDQRLLLIMVNTRMRARHMNRQIRFENVQTLKVRGGLGSSVFMQLSDGSKITLMAIRKQDRKLIEPMLEASEDGDGGGIEHLCPRCAQHVPGPAGSTLRCPNGECGIPFRDPKKAAALSGLMPGIGDIYLGHHFFGVTELFGTVIATAVGISFLFMAVHADTPSDRYFFLGFCALMIIVPRVIDYPLTLHMGRKGLSPRSMRGVNDALSSNVADVRAFPWWGVPLFALSAVVLALVLWKNVDEFKGKSLTQEAAQAARAGDLQAARAGWEEVKRAGGVEDDGIARMAIASYEGGDVLEGNHYVELLGGAPVEESLADDINTFVAGYDAAIAAYNLGVDLVNEHDLAGARKHFEEALPVLRGVHRPHYGHTLGEVFGSLLADNLAPPRYEEDLPLQRELFEQSQEGMSEQKLALLKAGMRHAEDGIAPAPEIYALSFGPKEGSAWPLLQLELRALTGGAPAEVAEAAEEIVPGDLIDEARRGLLIARGGRAPELTSEALAIARGRALQLEWTEAARALGAPTAAAAGQEAAGGLVTGSSD